MDRLDVDPHGDRGSNCREIIDNVVDMAHFFYVHYALPDYFKNVFEGQTAAQYMNSHGRPDVAIMSSHGDSRLESIAAYYGPSYMLNPMVQYYGWLRGRNDLTNCHYPIDENNFVLMYGVMAKIPEGLTAEQGQKMASKISAGIEVGFLQDVEIWKHKTRIDNPLLVEEDGPVYQLRRWYEQFYVDADDVTEEMVQRFEYEIDTTKAVENWNIEVQENLAPAGGSRRRGGRQDRRGGRGLMTRVARAGRKRPTTTTTQRAGPRLRLPPPATASTTCATVSPRSSAARATPASSSRRPARTRRACNGPPPPASGARLSMRCAPTAETPRCCRAVRA